MKRSILETGGLMEARFWRRVDRRGPDDCWLWTGGTKAGTNGDESKSYGMMKVDGVRISATHVSLFLSGRPRPPGMNALHSCDTPRCVNDRHLRWGTTQDNSDDMVSRGRHRYVAVPPELVARGEAKPNARLTADLVRLIRSSSVGTKAFARQLGVAPKTIRQVRQGVTWAHVV